MKQQWSIFKETQKSKMYNVCPPMDLSVGQVLTEYVALFYGIKTGDEGSHVISCPGYSDTLVPDYVDALGWALWLSCQIPVEAENLPFQLRPGLLQCPPTPIALKISPRSTTLACGPCDWVPASPGTPYNHSLLHSLVFPQDTFLPSLRRSPLPAKELL